MVEHLSSIADYIVDNSATLFSGLGVVVLLFVLRSLRKLGNRVSESLLERDPMALSEEEITLLSHISDVFIDTVDGSRARFQKTIEAKVTGKKVSEYIETVSTVGSAENFTTELGAVVGWKIISGFYNVKIEMGKVFKKKQTFSNVFRCDLLDTFPSEHEDWSPRIVIPTDLLVIRIHFPPGRPFKAHYCSISKGWNAKRLDVQASEKVIDGKPVLEWAINKPVYGAVYKLEWHW